VFDRVHYGDMHGVELDAHPYYLVQIRGEWEHCRHSILAGIIKDSADRPAYIEITGQDDEPTSRLTGYEADQLAETLHALAATLRGEDKARH
jgi:hypothetical protein